MIDDGWLDMDTWEGPRPRVYIEERNFDNKLT